jgi:hypothetical protein
VAIHALTARVDSQGFVSMAGSAYGFAWTNSRERLQAPHSEWSSAGQEDFGHIEVGIRRVRSLGPQLGARY